MQPSITNTGNDADEESFSFKILIHQWANHLHYVANYWRILAVAGIFGGLLGLGYAWLKYTTYTARLTFVVEESKGSSGGSIASALAGQFGFDLGGLSGTSGVLAGDNVLQLLKSRVFIKKTLLTPYNDSSTKSLADVYAEVYQWKDQWANDSKTGSRISFPANREKLARLQDSLLQKIIKRIVENDLLIAKPDKKLGFFEIQVTTRDEKLSQLFCERLLQITTSFYVDTKTRRLRNNVDRLERRADSLELILDKKTFSTADVNRSLLDLNPSYSTPMVDAEISSRNKFIQSTVYAEIVKNLEVSKTALLQETPTVQIVDYPEMPLKKNKTSFLLAILAGLFGGVIGVSIILLLGKRRYS